MQTIVEINEPKIKKKMESDLLYFIFIPLILMALDFLIGNRLFPSKVMVLKQGDKYIVMKIHRLAFIPYMHYAKYDSSFMDRTITDFTKVRRNAMQMSLEDAISVAKRFSNKATIKDYEEEIVWSSKQKTKKHHDEQIDELLQQLFKTKEIENKLPILEKIQKLKK